MDIGPKDFEAATQRAKIPLPREPIHSLPNGTRLYMHFTDRLPVYLFDASNDLVPVYEVWIGYTYLGTITHFTQTYSTTLLPDGKPKDIYFELHFDWGTLKSNAKYVRRLKTVGKFRTQLGRAAPAFTLVQLSSRGYLLAGQQLLCAYDDKAQITTDYRQIEISLQYLNIVSAEQR